MRVASSVGHRLGTSGVGGVKRADGFGGGERNGSEKERPEIHKPHNTINPQGFMSFSVLARDPVRYRMRNIIVTIFKI